ncbi:MAG: transcriptional regulator [Bacteroidetes bacterium]|nr:MAG: transcriptional regulator [Bacteroidota bacterium]
MIETLISSKTRVKLLLKFFLNSSNSSYLRGLEAEFGESSNAIRLELNKLEKAGLLDSNVKGNKKYFQANTKHPLFNDINSILLKFTGLDKIIEKVVRNLGDLDQAYVVGSLAKGLASEVIDLVFVGDIDKAYLFELIQKVEEKLDKKIKYLCYTPAEFSEGHISTTQSDYLLLWSK